MSIVLGYPVLLCATIAEIKAPLFFARDWRQCKHSLIAFFKLMVEGMKKTGEPMEAGQEKVSNIYYA